MYINVHVDEDEVIEEISDKQLIKEMKRRKLKNDTQIDISEKEKIFQLRSAALELRKFGRIANAVWLEDIASEIEE